MTTFTPIDILRGTLGVGPCQYILQTEGLASDANPTPDNVMTWVEKQFSRKKEKKAADEIRERLAQMVEHVGQAQATDRAVRPHVCRGGDDLRHGSRGGRPVAGSRGFAGEVRITRWRKRKVSRHAPVLARQLADQVTGVDRQG